jgi:nitroimidazol reductase NimA-like FMN-containing flavoprotein (pyridoxamine 5'-phosphate oxidase superfamily)
MPRERIAMTRAEVEAFLGRKGVAIVGTVGPDGAPEAEPARLAWAADGLRFEVPAHGPSDQNLRRDPRVVCSVEEFPSYAEIKGVAVHGRAVAIDAGEAGSQVAFRIENARVESFDFRKMRRV